MTRVRVVRADRRGARGQSLVIFALCAVVLFGVMGLAVDSGISYLSADRAERAAAAGALAGVTYMPSQYTTAVSAAQAAAARNGYSSGVTVYRVPRGCDASGSAAGCSQNRLGVSVTTTVNNTFVQLLGFGASHPVTQAATAEFLSTLTLGQPDPHLGSTAAQINASPQSGYYFLRLEGWGTNRQQGDAFTPNPNGSTDIHLLNAPSGTEACASGCSGFNALPSRGGYSFDTTIPASGVGSPRIQVYNPAFAPNGNPGNTQNINESDSLNASNAAEYQVMEYTLYQVTNQFDHTKDIPIGQVLVDPINATPNNTPNTWTDERTGKTVSPGTVSLASGSTGIYQQWVDLFCGCGYTDTDTSGGHLIQVVQPYAGSLVAGQTYRLRVDVLNASGQIAGGSDAVNGHKAYALRVVDGPAGNNADAECATCKFGGLNEFAFYTPLIIPTPSTTKSFNIPVVDVPQQYAGNTVDFYAYDPGDTPGNNFVSIVNPTTGAPACVSSGSIQIYNLGSDRSTPPGSPVGVGGSVGQQPDPKQARIVTSVNGNNSGANGNWFLFKIPVPTTYSPGSADATQTCSTSTPAATSGTAAEYWSLRYELTNTSSSGGIRASDTLTLAIQFDGPPVHLVPNG